MFENRESEIGQVELCHLEGMEAKTLGFLPLLPDETTALPSEVLMRSSQVCWVKSTPLIRLGEAPWYLTLLTASQV